MGNLTIGEDFELIEKSRQIRRGAYSCLDGSRGRIERRIDELIAKRDAEHDKDEVNK